jgi:DNA-binding XRE family transcriptional regulator
VIWNTAIVSGAVNNCVVKLDQLVGAVKKRTAEGTVIRRLRLKAGISQENLAQQVGVTTHTIWRLENDPSANPRLETLRSVAKALGVHLSELVSK